MLFQIIKVGVQGRKAYKHPGEFTGEAVRDVALSFVILPLLGAVALVVLLFLLSFTHVLGGPYFLAKIFFWILFVTCLLIGVPAYLYYRLVRRISKKVGEQTDRVFVESHVKE